MRDSRALLSPRTTELSTSVPGPALGTRTPALAQFWFLVSDKFIRPQGRRSGPGSSIRMQMSWIPPWGGRSVDRKNNRDAVTLFERDRTAANDVCPLQRRNERKECKSARRRRRGKVFPHPWLPTHTVQKNSHADTGTSVLMVIGNQYASRCTERSNPPPRGEPVWDHGRGETERSDK